MTVIVRKEATVEDLEFNLMLARGYAEAKPERSSVNVKEPEPSVHQWRLKIGTKSRVERSKKAEGER